MCLKQYQKKPKNKPGNLTLLVPPVGNPARTGYFISMSRKNLKNRTIIHLDMDAFYASVEMLDNPELRGKPLVVGGLSSRSVVSAASYEARKFGIHSAMPTLSAHKLCPDCIFMPVRMGRYQEVSAQIMAIFKRFTPFGGTDLPR